MRNPDRIGPTLAALEKVWRANPDLRLGQLIFACAIESKGGAFNMEEDELMVGIKSLSTPPCRGHAAESDDREEEA